MIENAKRFIRRNRTTIVAVAATTIPLIVLNVKFFKANREWASRDGCHSSEEHVLFPDEIMKKLLNGAKRSFGTGLPEDIMFMTARTYAKEWREAENFMDKHGLLEEFYKN